MVSGHAGFNVCKNMTLTFNIVPEKVMETLMVCRDCHVTADPVFDWILQLRQPANQTEPVPTEKVRQINVHGVSLVDVQKEDPDLSCIINWMETEPSRPEWKAVSAASPLVKVYLAEWDALQLVDGALHRRWEDTNGRQHRLLPVLPKEVMQQLHDNPTSGHFGYKKICSSVYERSSTGLDVARPSRIGVNGAICVPHEKDHTNGNMDQLRFTSVAPLWSEWPLKSSVHYRKQNKEIGICWWRWITSRNGLKYTHYPTKKR